MTSSGGSPGALAISKNQSPTHNKRVRVDAAATDLVGASSNANTTASEEKRQRKAAAAAPTISTPPLPTRYPPFSSHVAPKALHRASPARKTLYPWELRISKLSEKDPRRDLPTVIGPPDEDAARDVISSKDKVVVQDAARSVVSISVYLDDENPMSRSCFTGFVVGWNQTMKCARILTSSKTITGFDPKPKSAKEGKLLFLDRHYDIALLEISSKSDLPLQLPSFGPNPNYGQEVFMLGRDNESYLMARRGRIEWLEEIDYLGHHCHMFLSCEIPRCGHGGLVIDLDGNVMEMLLDDASNPPMLAISTILTFMEMWTKFSGAAGCLTEGEALCHSQH